MSRRVVKSRQRASFFRAATSAALLATLIVLALNLWVAGSWSRLQLLRDADTFVWAEKLNLLESGSLDEMELLILGDSQAMSGILPRELGVAAYNLGLPSMQPEGLLLLESLIGTSGRVRRVLISVSPYVLFRSEVGDAFRTYARSTLAHRSASRALLTAGIGGHSAGERLEILLLQFPLYRAHHLGFLHASFEQRLPPGTVALARRHPELVSKAAVNTFLRSRWRPLDELDALTAANQRIRRIMAEEHGFWTWRSDARPGPATCRPAGSALSAPAGGHQLFRNRPEAAAHFRAVLRRLKARGLEVDVVQLPFSAVWHSSTRAVEVYGRQARLLKELEQDFAKAPGSGRLRVHDLPAWSREDGRLFHDWTHLSYCGARRYTRWLRGRLDGSLR